MSRFVSPLIALVVGVGSGVYVFSESKARTLCWHSVSHVYILFQSLYWNPTQLQLKAPLSRRTITILHLYQLYL